MGMLVRIVMDMRECMAGLVEEMQRVREFFEFGDSMELIVCGTHFKKAKNMLISYSSGGENTTID